MRKIGWQTGYKRCHRKPGLLPLLTPGRGIFCKYVNIYILPVPEKLCVIGIDNEELTRYLSRVALSSVAQGARQMGYQAAKLLHRLLDKKKCRYSEFWSHQFASLNGAQQIIAR
ncbi:truncated xylose operon regulator [Escherichia coli]|uniref:Truncated xylose operon regulator n=1 Tax=Escherichia coli TaxID=562 RepID=A0A2X3LL17_ECOLX|nr:truncated xylose operon regulator [Escherichia coli]